MKIRRARSKKSVSRSLEKIVALATLSGMILFALGITVWWVSSTGAPRVRLLPIDLPFESHPMSQFLADRG